MKNLSLRIWVIGGVLATIVSSVALGTWLFLSSQQKKLLQEVHETHGRVTRVLALGVQKAVWDLSPESAAPLGKSVMDDPRIVSVKIFDANNEVFWEDKDEKRRIGTVVTQEVPIKAEEQVLGKVVVEFSMAQAAAEIRSRMVDFIGLAVAEIIGCVLVLAVLLHFRVLSRIDRLKAEAHEIAEKRLTKPFVWNEKDEIGSLGQSLEITRQSLAQLFAELEQKNKSLTVMNDQLEVKVQERTATIKMILDHVKTGFLLIDRNFTILEGYTRSCEVLLNSSQIQAKKLSLALNLHGEVEKHFQLALLQVFEDEMPESVSLGQIPKTFVIGDRTISLEGSTIRDASGHISKILFTIVDVTLLKSIELENQINRSIVNIMQNMNSFRDFIQDSRDRLKNCYTAIETGNMVVLRRDLHTLKGNSAAFGIRQVADLIHSTEDKENIVPEYLTGIEESLREFLDKHYSLLKLKFDTENRRLISIDEHVLDEIERDISQLDNGSELKDHVNQWLSEMRKDTVESMLGPISSYVQKLASQRGIDLDFIIEGGDIRMGRDEAADIFQNLVHLFRNAVDHGLEPSFERGNKPERARLMLKITAEDQNYLIRVEDDGRGIDAQRVLKKALDMGILSAEAASRMKREDILQLIFNDGLSTAETITDISGRGVGMKAVKDAIESAGGQIHIQSQVGVGTQFLLRVPMHKSLRGQRSAA
ncbi:MAG TPA: ATP-binding protein [Oligoflexus sp.]|uniref:ATP-binding protein n=1 Tax=Oligoflexus sp. TaxID=1971216 RepID=UPI002D803977|nr:ATP-binding protein [Oligoflexus sp.]HET9237980.1 ATP-binding protein [Oligoflexus sp.]